MAKYYKDGEKIQGTDGKSGYDLGSHIVFDGKTYYRQGDSWYCPSDGKTYHREGDIFYCPEDGNRGYIDGDFLYFNQEKNSEKNCYSTGDTTYTAREAKGIVILIIFAFILKIASEFMNLYFQDGLEDVFGINLPGFIVTIAIWIIGSFSKKLAVLIALIIVMGAFIVGALHNNIYFAQFENEKTNAEQFIAQEVVPAEERNVFNNSIIAYNTSVIRRISENY